MCGIFRSISKNTFNKQFEANLERGASSFGGILLRDVNYTVIKSNYTKAPPKIHANEYLGHLRAPTGDCRQFSATHSHPFEYKDWVVAHNGILTNFNELLAQMPNNINDPEIFQVDSSIIPYYLHAYGFSAFDKFKGTWACWMYQKESDELFVTRSDNTLFTDPMNGDFSSKQIEGYVPLAERKVFKIHRETGVYEEVHSYNTKPLYFIPR
jgi:predicted glutamine amidotransferase